MKKNPSIRFKPPSIQDFQRRFATEEDCIQFLFARRWPKDFICPRCGGRKHYPIKGRHLYECAACRYQVSVTAGTVLHKTRTPLCQWFMAAFLMATDKRGISSVGLADRLDISQKKAWYMLHKLRRAMGERDGGYLLDGLVELAEGFFGPSKEGGSRGRTKARSRVLAGLSLTPEGKPRYLRLRVLAQIDRAHLEPTILNMVAPGAHIRTDGLRSFLSLGRRGFVHELIKAGETPVPEELRWLRIVLSNAKALIGGTHHGLGRVGGKHMQSYLDEFAYRFARRHRPDTIFNHLIAAAAACPICTYRDITGRSPLTKKTKPGAA